MLVPHLAQTWPLLTFHLYTVWKRHLLVNWWSFWIYTPNNSKGLQGYRLLYKQTVSTKLIYVWFTMKKRVSQKSFSANANLYRIWSKQKTYHHDCRTYRTKVLLSMKLKLVHPVTRRVFILYTLSILQQCRYSLHLNGETHWTLVGLWVADGMFTPGPVMPLAVTC